MKILKIGNFQLLDSNSHLFDVCSMLVVATSGTGYILGTGNAAISFPGLCYTCAGTMMIAASANSLNQVSFLSLSFFVIIL